VWWHLFVVVVVVVVVVFGSKTEGVQVAPRLKITAGLFNVCLFFTTVQSGHCGLVDFSWFHALSDQWVCLLCSAAACFRFACCFVFVLSLISCG